MTKELNKIYNPSDVERKWYVQWENDDTFKPDSDQPLPSGGEDSDLPF